MQCIKYMLYQTEKKMLSYELYDVPGVSKLKVI